MTPASHWHVPGFLVLGGIAGAVIFVAGDYVWKQRQSQNMTAATLTAEEAEVTPQAQDLVSGLTPLAPDTNSSLLNEYDLMVAVPGSPVQYDPYTGASAEEIDPTTGEIFI